MSDLTTMSTLGRNVEKTRFGRLVESQTAVDFIGKRKWGVGIAGVLIVATVISLFSQGLSLGIDFEGGISWDVPAANFSVDDAQQVLAANGLSTEGARLQRRSSDSGEFIKVQVGDQPESVGQELRGAFAEAAGVTVDEINVNLVSSSWGSDITNKAIRALVIFLLVVAIFISIRFQWRMALASIIAMIHDVAISVGIYSIFQFIVTPATVIAFLTILGYSLYDTIVVFDRISENEARFATQKPPYDDILNVSMNQVLMRSLNTSFSAIVPVVSMLLIGAGLLGATTLSEFAIALLVGLITGAYSSIFVATPLLGILKQTDPNWKSRNLPRATGEVLRDMVMGGTMGSRKSRVRAAAQTDATAGAATGATAGATSADATTRVAAALSHPPRPRKKKRR